MEHTVDAHRTPAAAAIREELDRLIAGPLASSPQLGRFLRYIVDEDLAGRAAQLKEYTVAVRGLGKPDGFDPAADAAVRVAARQLRFKLGAYYADAGANARVVIDVPKGGYAPRYEMRAPVAAHIPATVPAPSTSAPPPRVRRVLLAGGVCLALLGALAVARHSSASPRRERAIIAVLPFANLTGVPGDELLSDGLSDEVTSAIARDTTARVIARTSAWRFRDSSLDVRTIGRRLGATHVLEGSVRRLGTRYRISVQLNGTAGGETVWADQFDVDRDAAFGLYDLIASRMHEAMMVRLAGGSSPWPARQPPRDPRVARWLAEARYFWNQRTDSGFVRALAALDTAATADSAYAPTWALLGAVRATMEMNHVTIPGLSAAVALQAAARALALDSTLGEAWTTVGMMRGFHEWRWEAADSAFRRAVVLAPSFPTAHSWYSNLCTALDDVACAMREIEDAERLDPLSMPIAYGVAQAAYYGRRWDTGLRAVERAIALAPDNPWSKRLKAKLLRGAGRTTEARALFSELGDSVDLALFDTVRRAREVPRLLAKLTADEQGRSQFWLATNFAQIGMTDSALAWLERGYAVRQADMSSILADPMIDPLKRDPRYVTMVQRMGLGGRFRGAVNR